VFDDHAVYINEATILWVYASGIENEEAGKGTEADPYSLSTQQHQVKGELLEYGRILYKSLLHELEQERLDWDRVFLIKERQVQFDLDLSETGQFGEIRDLLAEGLRARRIPELKEQTLHFSL
jgi:hypothetical protein